MTQSDQSYCAQRGWKSGTASYKNGCRCVACRAAMRRQKRRQRERWTPDYREKIRAYDRARKAAR